MSAVIVTEAAITQNSLIFF